MKETIILILITIAFMFWYINKLTTEMVELNRTAVEIEERSMRARG